MLTVERGASRCLSAASMDCDVRSQDREMKNGFSAWYEDLSVDGLMFPSDLSQVPDVCVAGLETRDTRRNLQSVRKGSSRQEVPVFLQQLLRYGTVGH